MYYGDTSYDRKTGRSIPDKFSSDWVVMAKPRSNKAVAAEVMHLFGSAPTTGRWRCPG